MIKFSIVTPSYNQAKFIEETIESIWNQKGYFQIQHMVIDGKSSDETIKILEKYSNLLHSGKFKVNCKKIEFKWISEPDKGQSDAINKGFKMANGDIYAYLNSDDAYCPKAFHTMEQEFERNKNADVIYGDYYEVDKNSKKIRYVKTRKFDRQILLNNGCFIGQPATFFKKEVYLKTGPFNEKYNYVMDYDFWCRASEKFSFNYLANKPLANFRLHEKSKTVSQKNESWNELRKVSLKNGGKFFSKIFIRRYRDPIFYWYQNHISENLRKIVRPLVKFL